MVSVMNSAEFSFLQLFTAVFISVSENYLFSLYAAAISTERPV